MKSTILFADNERGIRQFCRQELEADGFRVVLADDGEDAVNLLSREPIDLAILDEYMPRCSGRESAGRIKRTHAQLPVILFTADTFLESYVSQQVDATVIKSHDLTELRSAIARLLPAKLPHVPQDCGDDTVSRSSAVTVNAAFLQEIKDENENLSALLTSLKAWVDRGPYAYHQRDRFIQLLADLQDELALHFSLEEGYGYFDDALAVAPELSSRAEALRNEHKNLYLEITRLAELAEATNTKTNGMGHVLARARAFLYQLQEHEYRENELIMRAYNDDFGVGD